ncbi:MAG: bifunctional precorrin-2 dehydrogenase/sirohydrochlorin ferrochelatase, partial [Gammaproteobacteria bacterium]|nr:bifunctional precorrin-2 dehydrogenase/sirohydrochlorin ferrochelatase [Gammaproteobacteria bacterium]
MKYLPVHLNLKDVPCLVVGAGAVAAGKAAVLLRAGGNVSV